MATNSLLKKFLSFSIGNWLGLIIALISTPIITRLLSPKEFGIYSLYTVILNLFLIISMLGTDQSFVRFFYEGDKRFQRDLLYKCLYVSLGVFVIISFILLNFYSIIGQLIFNNQTFSLALLLVVGLFFSIINRFSLLIVRMEQRGSLYSALQVLMKILDFSFVVVVSFSGVDIIKYQIPIFSMIFSYFIVTLLSIYATRDYWFFFREKKQLNNSRGGSNKELIQYGFPLSITLTVTWIFQYIDRFFITEFSNYEELGLYAAAFKIVAILNIIQTTFTTFWLPVSLERFKNNRRDFSFFSNVFNIVSFAMLFLAIFTIMCKDLIIHFLGPKYGLTSYIFPFLVFIPVMYTISEVTVVGINFFKKSKWHIFISLLVCFINTILNIVLVPVLGAKGAAIATGISYIFFFYVRTFVAVRFFNPGFNIKIVSFFILLILIYACYSTFVSWNLFNLIMGLSLIFILILLYMNSIYKIRDYLSI